MTNLRAMRGCQYMMLKDCDDVVAVNLRKKLGVSVGDVQFIKQGAPAIIFAGVRTSTALSKWPTRLTNKCLRSSRRLKNDMQPGLEELAAPAAVLSSTVAALKKREIE